jgi:hypothetical protein
LNKGSYKALYSITFVHNDTLKSIISHVNIYEKLRFTSVLNRSAFW